MNKLLCADLTRLLRSKVLYLCLIAMAFFAVYVPVAHSRFNSAPSLDSVFLGYAILIGVPAALFCGLFLGTEYSDGVLRNKLMVGHTRSSVYLSCLVTSVLACLMMMLVYLLVVSTVGLALLGGLRTDLGYVLLLMLDSLMMIIATCSLFTLLCMTNSSKAASSVVCLLLAVGLIVLAIAVDSRLHAPEFYSDYLFQSSTGEIITGDPIPNPEYLTGSLRALFEFFYDFLPAGQGLQISNLQAQHLWQMPLYSFIIAALTTLVGLFLFGRKDLK